MIARRIALLSAVFALGVACVMAAGEEPVVATVNGDAITQREFVEALRRQRTRFTEAAALRQAALDDCVRFKVLQQLARDHHLLDDTSDVALRRSFTEENSRRAQALARGEVVYGPTQLGWEHFRLTWRDRVQRDLTRLLVKAAGPESDAELRAFHATHASKFTAPGATTPLPFAEVADHVRAEYRDNKFRRYFDRALAAASVRPNPGVIVALTPNTALATESER